MLMLIKNNILYIIVFVIGIVLGISGCSYFKNITINDLKKQLSELNSKILKQDNDYKSKILEINNATKAKEKENYDNYKKTIDDNQNRIDSLVATNSGLRVKIKRITSASSGSIESTNVGDGISSGQGQTAELDTTTSSNTLRIMQRCDKYKEQLTALQDYINTYNSKFKN